MQPQIPVNHTTSPQTILLTQFIARVLIFCDAEVSWVKKVSLRTGKMVTPGKWKIKRNTHCRWSKNTCIEPNRQRKYIEIVGFFCGKQLIGLRCQNFSCHKTYAKIHTAEILMLVSGKIQAKIKAKTAVECLYWNPWNVLTRMHMISNHYTQISGMDIL